MIQTNTDFIYLDSPFNDTSTKGQLSASADIKNSVAIDYVSGTVTFSNLEITNGYLKNKKQTGTPIAQTPITVQLVSDFSVGFAADFQPLLEQPLQAGLRPSEVFSMLQNNQKVLRQYISYPQKYLQIETPAILVSSNDILGTITFDVQFFRYYENGKLIGPKKFTYTYGNLKAWLPVIIGIVAAIAGIGLAVAAYFVYRHLVGRRDRYLNVITKEKKTGTKGA